MRLIDADALLLAVCNDRDINSKNFMLIAEHIRTAPTVTESNITPATMDALMRLGQKSEI